MTMREKSRTKLDKRLKKMVAIAASRPGHGKHRLYSEIWRDDGVRLRRVAFGWNNEKDSDLAKKYEKDNPLRTGTCAEAEAIIQALSKHQSVLGATILVVRARKNYRGGPWVPGESRPCPACRKMIDDFGISDFGHYDPSYDAHVFKFEKTV